MIFLIINGFSHALIFVCIASQLLNQDPVFSNRILQVAKAIADGAIDAVIASEGKGERFMQSNETVDVYRTTEPQFHYDNRIKCVGSSRDY